MVCWCFHGRSEMQFWLTTPSYGMNSNKLSYQKYVFEQNEYNSSPILELSVKFASQICYENTNIPLDGTYLADFGIDISPMWTFFSLQKRKNFLTEFANAEKQCKNGLTTLTTFPLQHNIANVRVSVVWYTKKKSNIHTLGSEYFRSHIRIIFITKWIRR